MAPIFFLTKVSKSRSNKIKDYSANNANKTGYTPAGE